METIGSFEAKTRLSELLERTQRGEAFQITKHGRPVGKLIPPDTARDPEVVAQAVQRLKKMRGLFRGMTKEEFLDLKHQGHRF
ncbi:MAG: type II toxin-antitoxin system prevent-host-death family antitoxin [Tepidisphaeraceae bacterium]|jgi:prevent-host-death family protein